VKTSSVLLLLSTLAACGGTPPSPVDVHVAAAKSVAAAPQAKARTRPSAASKRILASAGTKVSATAFVSTGAPRYDAIARSLRMLFKDYEAAVPGAVSFSLVRVDGDPARERAKAADLDEHEFEDEAEAKKTPAGYAGLVLEQGETKERINFLAFDDDDELEYWISEKLREVVARTHGTKWTIGIPTGHDESHLDGAHLLPSMTGQKPSLRSIFHQFFPMYVFADVDLGKPIAGTVDALLVTQPARDYTDAELRAVDAFALSGKPVAIVAGAANIAAGDRTMKAAMSTHRLDALTAGWGIEMKRNVLLDHGRSFSVRVATSEGDKELTFPAFPEVTREDRLGSERLLDPRFAPFFRIPAVPMPFASELVLHPDKQPRAQLRAIARSTPKTTRETGETVDLTPLGKHEPHGTPAVATIAALAEGELASAFDPSRRAKAAHVFVLASSGFFVNPFARATAADLPPGQIGPFSSSSDDDAIEQIGMPYAQNHVASMILVAKNLLDWMTDPAVGECLQP
jgi:hypothetical protein